MRKAKPKSVKDIFYQFASRTSVRGIPQVVKAEGLLKFIWMFFVTTLFAGCIINLHMIVDQYLEFDTIQQPKRKYNSSATFPSFTVCNQKAFSQAGEDLIRKNHWPTPREYWKNVFFEFTSKRRQIPKIIGNYYGSFLNLLSYWSNLPDKNFDSTLLGFKKNEFLLSCFITLYSENDDPPIINKKCNDVGKWRTLIHPDHLNCYMFTLNSESAGVAISADLELFLDYSLVDTCTDCLTLNEDTQLWGARTVLHEYNSYPDITKNGFNVMPGTMTEVKFVPNAWKRMEPPYGTCNKNVPHQIRLHNEMYAYDAKLCKDKSRQQKIVKICNCYTATLPYGKKVWNNLSSCERFGNMLNFTIDDLKNNLRRVRCFNNIMHKDKKEDEKQMDATAAECGSPCFFYTYDTTVTQAAWPRPSFYTKFVSYRRKKMKNFTSTNMNRIFAIYEQLSIDIKKAEKMNDTSTKNTLLLKLHSSDFISRCFLKLKFSKKDYYVKMIDEKPVRTLPSTLSQVGGLLSMWIGLTLIWIVEVIDLTIKLIMYFMQQSPSSSNKKPDNNFYNHVNVNKIETVDNSSDEMQQMVKHYYRTNNGAQTSAHSTTRTEIIANYSAHKAHCAVTSL